MIVLALLAALDDEPSSAPVGPNEAAPPPTPSSTVAPPPEQTPPASERDYPFFDIGFRSGASIPIGGMAQGVALAGDVGLQRVAEPVPMADVAGLHVPVIVDIGARLSPALFVGGYGSVGFGGTSARFDRETCQTICTAASIHVGAQAHLHLAPERTVDPWIGIGTGYEWFTTSGSPSVSASGFELARPMAGVDFRLSRSLDFGIFVDGTVAAYTNAEIENTRTTPGQHQLRVRFDEDLDRPYIHSWLTAGIRIVLHGSKEKKPLTSAAAGPSSTSRSSRRIRHPPSPCLSPQAAATAPFQDDIALNQVVARALWQRLRALSPSLLLRSPRLRCRTASSSGRARSGSSGRGDARRG